MNPEEIKIRFKNGSIPDENDFGILIDEATKKVDLTEYATKDEIPTVPDVSQFITLEDIPPTDLSDYAKISDIPSLDGLLSENTAAELYVRKDNLDTILADYAKKTEIPTTDHLATKEEIPDVSGFITLDEVPKVDLSEHAKKTELKSLQEYTNKELSALNKGTKGIYSNKNTNSYLVVQDDDISIRLYTEIYPWAKQKGIPIVAALVTNFIDTDGYISYEQFVEMKESGVVEFVNHTQNHLRLADLTPEEIHYEIGECEKFLMNEGIHTKHLVYPYGSISDTVKEISSHYVNSATKSNQRIIDNSKSLLDRFQINRIVLEHGVNNFNNRITEAINRNGSIIINVHAHYESFDISDLDTIVTNAENAGMKVVNYTTLFEKIENPIDIKRNNSTVLGVSSEGYIEGIGETITRLDQVNFSLTPEAHLDEYPIGSLVVEITTAKSRELGWQMPEEQAAAVLETYNNHYDYAYQILPGGADGGGRPGRRAVFCPPDLPAALPLHHPVGPRGNGPFGGKLHRLRGLPRRGRAPLLRPGRPPRVRLRGAVPAQLPAARGAFLPEL